MTALRGSCYGDAWLALTRILGEATWPGSGLGGAAPVKVAMTVLPKDCGAEWVLVETEPTDMSSQWVASGESARDEVLFVDVVVGTELPWPDQFTALARLNALTLTVEQTIQAYDRPNAPTELGKALQWWQVVRVKPQVGAIPNNAFGGAATLTVQINARRRPVGS